MYGLTPMAEADLETSGADYARRFSGAIGAWMLAEQERAVRMLLSAPPAVRTVLDVGGGHGQLARPLCGEYEWTVHGSAAACAEPLAREMTAGKIRFVQSPSAHLPFPDAAFDAVISVRLLPHYEEWQKLLTEMCRVARVCVIVDYPVAGGLQHLAPGLFSAKRKIEGNTRPWRAFTHSEISGVFQAASFTPAGRIAQFGAPMVLHRKCKSPGCSRFVEGMLRAIGWTRVCGSPMLARFNRSDLPAPPP